MKHLFEKIRVYGEDSLTTDELLSIVISKENTKEGYLKIAKNLIDNNKDFTGDLRFLMHISIYELIEQGLSLEQAAKLKAISGLLKKLHYPISSNNIEINSSSDVANLFMSELRYERFEIVKIVILNNKNIVLKIATLSMGTSNSATISPKDILSEPVKMKASRIILVHNHPSR